MQFMKLSQFFSSHESEYIQGRGLVPFAPSPWIIYEGHQIWDLLAALYWHLLFSACALANTKPEVPSMITTNTQSSSRKHANCTGSIFYIAIRASQHDHLVAIPIPSYIKFNYKLTTILNYKQPTTTNTTIHNLYNYMLGQCVYNHTRPRILGHNHTQLQPTKHTTIHNYQQPMVLGHDYA